MSRIFKSLGFRLFLWLTGVLLAILSVHTYMYMRHQRMLIENETKLEASRFVDVIRRSTYYSMLLNRKEDIYRTISAIGEQPGVETIRIFDKNGTVVYSTDSLEIGQSVDVSDPACANCHSGTAPLDTLNLEKRVRIFESAEGRHILGMSEPIFNEPACATASCHAHSPGQRILGVLDVTMSLSLLAHEMEARQKEIFLFAAVLIFAVTLTVGLFVWRFVHIPIQRLIHGTEQVARGNLDYRIPEKPADEFGKLARAFNRMTHSLKEANREIKEWSESLERRIQEKTEELKKAQKHILFVEKMASLGKLSAAVAHELNNPLAGMLNYTKLIQKKIKKGGNGWEAADEILQDLEVIASETMRCGKIVKNLLFFARQGKSDYQPCDINKTLQEGLQLVQHQMDMQNIEVSFEPDPGIQGTFCYPDQLKQAFLALFVNAIEAMPDGGKLTVRTKYYPQIECVEITVADTGVGIRPENLPHIFEPFFTTKDEMSGTGLGLSVVYGIVRQHKGAIEVQSQPDKGATFIIRLPAHPEGVVHCDEKNEWVDLLTNEKDRDT